MMHPNVVKYYKAFLEGEDYSILDQQDCFHSNQKRLFMLYVIGDKLYIVMELIEGVPLAQHFNSLKDKQQTFTEDRIWNIFIQVKVLNLVFHEKLIR